MEDVWRSLQSALSDWKEMQTTAGDEGAEVAERFERHFYLFIQQFEQWYSQLPMKPKDTDEAEEHEKIQEIIKALPDPLYITFLNELIRIVDGDTFSQYD